MPGMTMRMNVRRTAPPFNPLVYSPALWLDASDQSTLVMDGARSYVGTQNLSCVNNATLQTGDVDWWAAVWMYPDTHNSLRSALLNKGARDNSGVLDFELSVKTYDGVALSVGNGTTLETVYANASTYLKWSFVFGCKYGNTIYIYLRNTVTVESSYNLTITPSVTTQNLLVGGLGHITASRGFFSGYLDSACFGKPTNGWLASNATALRDYLYNSGSGRRSSDFMASTYYTGGNPSGAVSWWDMDARSGTETDRIGSNHLTDNGGVGYAAGVASGLVQYTGDPVKQWNDKSGNARHVTAASDAARPTYTTNGQNGLSVTTWDGVNDSLSITNSMLAGSNKATIFLVAKNTAGTSNRSAFETNDGYVQFQRGNAVYYSTIAGTGANYASYNTSSSSARIIAAVYDGTQTGNANRLKTYEDGVAKTLTFTGTIAATIGVGITDWYVGGRVASGFHDGQIMEILVIPSTLNDGDLAKFHRYLAQKWMSNLTGLTATVYSDYQFLEWTAVGMAGSYSVYYRLNGATSWTLATTTTSTFAVVSGLTAGLTYDFRVDAEFGA